MRWADDEDEDEYEAISSNKYLSYKRLMFLFQQTAVDQNGIKQRIRVSKNARGQNVSHKCMTLPTLYF